MYLNDVGGKMEIAREHFQELRAEADRERLVAPLRAGQPSLWQRLFGRRGTTTAPSQTRSVTARRKSPSLG